MHPHINNTVLRLRWLTMAMAAAVAAPSGAQERAAFELKQAVEIAWSRQPQARSAPQRREAAQAQRRMADAWMPEPAAVASSLRTGRLGNNQGAREIEIGVATPLWLAGERSRSQSLADAELAALDAAQRAAQWRHAGTVREAWWATHLAQQDAAAARARLSNAEQLAGDVARRWRAGDLARVDQHQADAALAAAQAELATTLAAQTQAMTALRALMGAAPAGGVALLSALPEAEPVEPAAIDAEHPAVAEWQSRAEAARRAQALASVQKRGNPELALATTRERGAAGERSAQTLTLGLRLPLGSDARSRNKAANAAAALLDAETALDIERDQLAAEVDAARALLAAARTALQAQERRAQLASETQGFVEKSFRLGQTDLPTRLRVDLEAAEAQRMAARARIALARAVSTLRQALGLMPQ